MQQEIYESLYTDMNRNLNQWEVLSEAAEKTSNLVLRLESSYFMKNCELLRKMIKELTREDNM